MSGWINIKGGRLSWSSVPDMAVNSSGALHTPQAALAQMYSGLVEARRGSEALALLTDDAPLGVVQAADAIDLGLSLIGNIVEQTDVGELGPLQRSRPNGRVTAYRRLQGWVRGALGISLGRWL